MLSRFAALSFLAFLSPHVSAQEAASEWQFQVTPYLWLPTIGGDLNYSPPAGGGGGGGGASIDVGPTDWLDLLNGAALLNGGMKKGRFSISADVVYLSLKSENDRVVAANDGSNIPVDASLNLATETKFDGASWTFAAGYSVVETPTSMLELIAGVRFFGVDVSTSWNLSLDVTGPGGGVVLPAQGSRKDETDFWDGIIGIRGHHMLGDSKWSVPYYLDIGTGSSDLTWQAMAGFTYSYNWGELLLLYRHLEYDEGSDGFMQGFSFSGPGIGARFSF